MKIHIIVDDGGNILGAMPITDSFDARIVPLPGQNFYELELPMESQEVQNLDQLYWR